MKKRVLISVFISFIAFLGFHVALADEVHLKNGDRISGKVIKMLSTHQVSVPDNAIINMPAYARIMSSR